MLGYSALEHAPMHGVDLICISPLADLLGIPRYITMIRAILYEIPPKPRGGHDNPPWPSEVL